ncbi:MAG: PhzF family phenazine biosynthesis protein [Thermodesulfobacteriota bacterium]|nr:PhzF family phenazine biosynthesis protein [Thermodesulfobacteriota bacterium]
MEIPYYHIDAFTGTLFAGNPAGVCLLTSWPDDSLLQAIAGENRLSETAFLVGSDSEYALRWFTPTTEVDLCGHATLAASFVLYRQPGADPGPLLFHSQSGDLRVSRDNEMLFLDFPSRKAEEISCPDLLVKALGAQPVATYATRDLMAVFESEEEIRELNPDFSLLARLDSMGCIVTAPGKEVDFVSRFFAPKVGINEDPVTGSAHCTLIPYWSKRLNKKELLARQVSARGGELLCLDEGKRVKIGGRATLYMTGTLHVPD